MVVDAAYRRTGIGRALVEEASTAPSGRGNKIEMLTHESQGSAYNSAAQWDHYRHRRLPPLP